MSKIDPVTAGELLVEEYLAPKGAGQYRLTREIDVPARRISEMVAGRRAITADTKLRRARQLCSITTTGGAWTTAFDGKKIRR